MRLILDIEADRLVPSEVQNVWCIVTKDIDTGEVHEFRSVKDAESQLKDASLVVGHNIIGYDYPVIQRFLPGALAFGSIADTLVLSRLLKYDLDDGEGHSLDAWGARFKSPKIPFTDFSKFTEDMLTYCKQDVEITYQLYQYLKGHLNDPKYNQAIETETQMAWICEDMKANGFKYDKTAADTLYSSLLVRLEKLDEQISVPDRLKFVREYTPKLTKHGTISRTSVPRGISDLRMFHDGCPFSWCKPEAFNPNSTVQLVEVLNRAGWQPIERTKTGKGFKINEVNLASLPDGAPPGIKRLVERILVAARVRTLKEWEGAYRSESGRIHGTFTHIGTWPGRMSHSRPNLGNIATKKSIKYKTPHLKQLAIDLGEQMRSMWICEEDTWLVGTDMDAAHVRLFAHYINDREFTRAIISGDKRTGTDVHSLNKRVLGSVCPDRDLAKTFLFSFFNGAGTPKVSETFGCSMQAARRALNQFNERYPGIRHIKETLCPMYAEQGWFPGLDGRKVYCNDAHLMFAGMLQSGESIVMKMANILWRKELDASKIQYKQVNLVHDEYVTEVRGDRELAEFVGRIQSNAIRRVGEHLLLRCPLDGEYKVGKHWLAVH